MHDVSRGPLGSRNFRLLSACSAISAGGSQIAAVALPFAVLSIGGSARCRLCRRRRADRHDRQPAGGRGGRRPRAPPARDDGRRDGPGAGPGHRRDARPHRPRSGLAARGPRRHRRRRLRLLLSGRAGAASADRAGERAGVGERALPDRAQCRLDRRRGAGRDPDRTGGPWMGAGGRCGHVRRRGRPAGGHAVPAAAARAGRGPLRDLADGWREFRSRRWLWRWSRSSRSSPASTRP